jgi:hypothetical protein
MMVRAQSWNPSASCCRATEPDEHHDSGDDTNTWLNRLFGLRIIPLAMVNIVVFVVVAMAIGGDALNGTSVDGHYYLASHGRLTEVSAGVFHYSEVHAVITQLLHFAAMIAAARFILPLWYGNRR